MSDPIDPRRVDWTGDNPGIYLKTSPDGAFTSLCVWFRIASSPHGPGHVLVLFEDPARSAHWPDVANVCLADNLPLARWLVDDFCTRFGVFRNVAAFDGLQVQPMTGVDLSTGTDAANYRVAARAEGIEIVLHWTGLGAPFAADVPPEQSATGRHRMLSVFVESHDAWITVNGRRLAGAPAPRPFFGRTASSAFLAFSETWIAV